MQRFEARRNAGLLIAPILDLLDVSPQCDFQSDDVAMQRRFAYGEEQVLSVLNGATRVFADQCEPRDFVCGADKPPQLRGTRDDRRVCLSMCDRWDVLDQADEELGSTHRRQFIGRCATPLHRLKRNQSPSAATRSIADNTMR